ncbi:hypothetical protein D9Q98_009774 [Chlorella vulgaris]|uniref:SAP domain-containing protein n=1 Tax=Chlorella vulgaris TaxID=3077 RepID=A0A9D4TF08_CHLVU|nr:hypothetical protein D9Q98_009774 [Chlorella vulgaris]
MVDQAAAAVQAALDAGMQRQTVVFLLPINEKEADFTQTEPVDYPCSLQKEFDTVCLLAKSLLQRLLGQGTAISAKRIDEGGVEGEPCGVLFPEDRSIIAVVFPTADRLKQLQAYAKTQGRLLLIINPQWRTEGQVISDFGIGPWKRAAEDFLATFQPTYVLKEKRIGSPGTVDAATGTRFASGGVVRVLRCYPGRYTNHAVAANGASQLMDATDAEPGYQELDAMIKRGRAAKLDIFRVAQLATAVYSPSGSDPQASASSDGDGTPASSGEGGSEGSEALAGLSDADIEGMDAATLRRMLVARGLPGSGRISKLRERLRELRDGK